MARFKDSIDYSADWLGKKIEEEIDLARIDEENSYKEGEGNREMR